MSLFCNNKKAHNVKQFSYELDAPEIEGEGKPRRNHLLKDGKHLIDTTNPQVTTLYNNFINGVKYSGHLPFLGTRSFIDNITGPYEWISYNEAFKRIEHFGSFLVNRGYPIKSFIGLYSINRTEWVLGEQACFMFNYCTVPLYDTLGEESVLYIINQTKQPLIICSKDKIDILLQLKPSLPSLKLIVSMDTIDNELKNKANNVGIELISFTDAENEGSNSICEPRPPLPDDLATICYTSGTTGLPKGAMLSHKSILSIGMSYQFAASHGSGVQLTKDDIHISYLPLAHVFERAIVSMVIGVGARIGFYQGNILKLLEDVMELRPTFFPSVPRLFNRIYDKIWANVKQAGGIKEALFRHAFNTKKANLHTTVKHFIYDKLVFAKVRATLGGRVRFMVTGSAPLSSDVMEFLRITFSCDILEGYGQTETCGASTITEINDYSLGHVGSPLPCVDVKLIDVLDMNYSTKDKPFPRGEICFKGPSCFSGYFDMPDKTLETIDKNGWVHSGDIGQWDAYGRLQIIDRKKNIFKLAQGEYIAPEKIESVYVNHELIAQAFVYGDSLQASLVAIIFPEENTLINWAKHNQLQHFSFTHLIHLEKVKLHILKELQLFGKAHNLKGFENVKNIYLDNNLMSVENNLLTPTFKIKRHEVKQKYQKEISDMYAQL